MRDGAGMATLRRRVWDLRRFGLAPSDLFRRVLADRERPRVLCVTLPKAGTHLLERLLCLHPDLYRRLLPTLDESNSDRYGGLARVLATTRPGQVVVSHRAYRPEFGAALSGHGVRGLFMLRDPRDVAVSLAHYIPRQPQHRFYELFQQTPDLHERIRLAIRGSEETGFPSMVQRLRGYRGWLGSELSDSVMKVHFEDLIGERGGGGASRQREVVAAILEHVGVRSSEELLGRLCAETFSEVSPTFRSGKIGGFRGHFEGSDLLEECERSFGEELREYGYS